MPIETLDIKSDAQPSISEIRARVESSRWILKLAPDWDDAHAQAYAESTWKTATDFVQAQGEILWKTYNIVLDVPQILPGPHGSIDVHWKTNSFELLINFPSGPQSMATFYGDDYRQTVIKGTLNPMARNPGLLIWLKELL